MILGLCGLARSGKDSFFYCCETLKFNKNPNKRIAFADKLKDELDFFLKSNFNISAFTNDPKEKEIIRPILVSYGMQKRVVSEGLYWINKLESEIIKSKSNYNFFITDVRFPNEVQKIKDIGGKCIYINRKGNLPINIEESENDPKIKKMADYFFEWEDFSQNFNKTLKVKNYLNKIKLL